MKYDLTHPIGLQNTFPITITNEKEGESWMEHIEHRVDNGKTLKPSQRKNLIAYGQTYIT